MNVSTPFESPAKHPDVLDGSSLFAKCPPIFVLSTHMTLDELHEVEDSLVGHGALLTYDVSEAKLVLGMVGQKKRAALELRSRGLWTEEVPVVGLKRPAKRQRLDEEPYSDDFVAESGVIDLSASSDEERGGKDDALDETRVARLTSMHIRESRNAYSGSLEEELKTGGPIKVIELQWLRDSLEKSELLPLHPYLIYNARVIGRPQKDQGPHTPESRPSAKAILERAKGDAASQPPPSAASHFYTRRPQGRIATSQRSPPKLYRETTSGHEQLISLPPAPDWVKNNVKYACMRSAPLRPPNERFIEQLIKIRKFRELTLDEIGVRAYSTSIAAIAAYPYKLRSPLEVQSLPGCDTKIATLFVEFQDSPDGTLEAANALDTDPVVRVLHQFYNIWGVGAKTARDFYYQREWRDLDDIIEHGWNSLSRVQQIGLKYYDELSAGIPRDEVERIAKTVHRHANLVRPGCGYDGRGVESMIVGGYRRGKEISGDIDLILTHRDESVTKNLIVDIVSSLETEGWVTHTLVLHMATSNREQQTLPYRGEDSAHPRFDSLDKALVVWQDPHFDDGVDPEVSTAAADGDSNDSNTTNDDDDDDDDNDDDDDDDDNDNDSYDNEEAKEETEREEQRRQPRKDNPNPHRRVDIIISPWRTVGCAVLGWSGDTTFERDLRRYTKKRHGWKFDSSGVRERITGGNVIDLERSGPTWEERERLVMEGLGVGWRPATERCTR